MLAKPPLVETFTTQDKTLPPTQFVVTNYEAVVRRLDAILAENWDVVIVDEASAIKNRKAKRTKAVHRVCHSLPRAWLLTATPIHNRPDELWSLLHAINPRYWSSYWRFVEKFCETCPNPWGGVEILGVRNKEALADEIAPVFLRRTKELLNLPPVSEEVVYVKLLPRQERLYRQMERTFVADVGDNKYVAAPSVLAQITRLRQIACSPALIGGVNESAKTEALMELLEELAACHKILVFTTFASYVDILLPLLEAYRPVVITGDRTAAQRDEAARIFREDDACRVLLGTIAAMSEGLNLQVADVVVFLDLSWSPVSIDQALGRAHRRGQTRPVHVYKLVAADTVDEDILELLNTKTGIIRDIDAVAVIARKAAARLKGGER